MDPEQRKKRFDVALQTRQLEIDLFWKRSLFFWGFISVAFAAVAGLKGEQPTLSLLISGFGLICSVSWALVNRGSKYWHEQWESKIEEEEKEVTGEFFLRRAEEQDKGWWLRGRKFSVSKVTIAVSDYVSFVWFCIFVRQVWICLAPFSPNRCKLGLTFILSVIPFVYLALVLGFAKATPTKARTKAPSPNGESMPLLER
ncbi:MAG TPA: hypothetical protein VFE08_14295 [Candidatus Sulfotelmatobacter sp.]|jgi:hypothetical protein|nr:hypothetical protein [Candidatus Sulfotelmatobacter sp.]